MDRIGVHLHVSDSNTGDVMDRGTCEEPSVWCMLEAQEFSPTEARQGVVRRCAAHRGVLGLLAPSETVTSDKVIIVSDCHCATFDGMASHTLNIELSFDRVRA